MNRIKELREQKGMKQSELGLLLNVNNSAISKYESGKLQLTDDTLEKLSDIFGVSIDYILFRTEGTKALSTAKPIKPDISKEDHLILNFFHQDPERIMELLSSFSKLSARNKTIILGKCFELEDEDKGKNNTEQQYKEEGIKKAT